MVSKLLMVLLCAVTLQLMVGCATPALMRVGVHDEEARRYTAAQIMKDALLVSYDVKITARGAELKGEKRWTTIPLNIINSPYSDTGSIIHLSKLEVQEGEIPPELKVGKDLRITRLTGEQQLSSLPPVTETTLVTYSIGDEDCNEFYILGKAERGVNLYSHVYTQRQTRHPAAYLLITPALPFTLLFDSGVYLTTSLWQ